MSQNNTKALLSPRSSYSLSGATENVANASVGLIFGSPDESFPQGFPQVCGKPPPLKVTL
jgi:hypothetical protein